MIWDDHQGRCIGELSFRSQVHGVRLRRDRIVVALEHKVLIYNFADLHLLQSIETLPNPLGLLALSSAPEQNVLATPGLHPGQARDGSGWLQPPQPLLHRFGLSCMTSEGPDLCRRTRLHLPALPSAALAGCWQLHLKRARWSGCGPLQMVQSFRYTAQL